MDSLNELSYIWESDKDNYVLVNDEIGCDIFCIEGKEFSFLLIEDNELHHAVVAKMLESGNVVCNGIDEIDEALGMK